MPDQKVPIYGQHAVPEGFDLLEHAKGHSRDAAEKLTEPNEDIMPVLMWIGPYGLGVMPLLDMSSDEAKDRLSHVMTTVLAISRATEAVQVTTSWAVLAKMPDDGTFDRDNPLDGVKPSQHRDRTEVVCLMHMTPDGQPDAMVHGKITRDDGKPPALGEWNDFGGEDAIERVGGRFGDAVHMGMDLVVGMPPQLVQIIDEGWELGKQEELIQRFHNVFAQFTEVMDNIERMGLPDGVS